MDLAGEIIKEKLRLQAKINEKLDKMPIENKKVIENNYVPTIAPKNISFTRVVIKNNTAYLCRIIDRHLIKVPFNVDVKLADVEEYFEIEDSLFIRLGEREKLI